MTQTDRQRRTRALERFASLVDELEQQARDLAHEAFQAEEYLDTEALHGLVGEVRAHRDAGEQLIERVHSNLPLCRG